MIFKTYYKRFQVGGMYAHHLQPGIIHRSCPSMSYLVSWFVCILLIIIAILQLTEKKPWNTWRKWTIFPPPIYATW